MAKRTCNFFAFAALFIIANVVTTSALKGGYEHVHTYNYEATVNVGVNGYVSEYNINGGLKIQRDIESNKYTLSLSDLKNDSYYGEENSMRIKDLNTIDNGILQIPFYVGYDETGMFKSIEHPTKQPEWAEKIKKSIANLLQFNWQIVQQGLSNDGSLDEDEIAETTVHGKCKVNYELKKKNKAPLEMHEKILLTRIYALNSCNKFTDNIDGYLTNDEYTKKAIEDVGKWDDSSIRNAYEIVINNEAPKLTMISNVENYEYSDNTDGLVVMQDNRQLIVKIRQYLTFLSANPDETLSTDFQKNEDEIVLPGGLGEKIVDLVLEAHNYTEKDHLEILIRGEEHRQLFNKIVSILKRFKPTDFYYLGSDMTENSNTDKIRKILIPVLPYVGTTDSIRYMLRYVIPRKDYISEELAINLLTVFPTYAEKSIEPLELLESFLRYNSFGPSLLSEKIYEAAILSLSHLLNRIPVEKDLMVERFMPNIVAAYDGAKTTSSKIAFLAAIGNIREISAVNKHTLPILSSILTQKKNTVIDQDRLRLAAINILSELVSYQIKDWHVSNLEIFDKLMVILKDKSESRSVRLAAYDVIISKNNYDIKILADIGKIISDDKDLYNYHVSTVKGLQQSGLISIFPKMELNPLGSEVSYSLSRSVILKADNVIKPELFKSTMKLQSGTKSYVKASLVYEDQSRTANWQIPAMVKFEILEGDEEKLVLNKAFYIHTNFNGLNEKKVFFDYRTTFSQNSRIHYYDNIEFKNLPDLLNLSEIILKKIHEKFSFMYNELTTFSVPTGFGIDAVFEHKYPNLISMLVDYNWKAEDNCLEAKIDFSLKESSNGYSGVSMYNPLSRLTHSIRKSQQLDSSLSIGFIVKYNFTNQQLNFTLPIYTNATEPKTSGLAVYTSTSVGVTDIDDEISCEKCGFKVTTRNVPVSLKFRRSDYHGMLLSTMPYNCDIEQNFEYSNFLGSGDSDNEVNTCGFIAMMKPNTSKPFSQIELLLDTDYEQLKNMEEPWYFLPGYKILFNLLIGNRQIIDNQFNHLLKLDFNLHSSQGHFINLLAFRFVKKTEENNNFIVCYEAKVDFPEIGDDHLPIDVTSSKLNAFSRVVMGHSQTELCSAIDFYVDFNVTGEVSEVQKELLEHFASDSVCSKQKDNPHYIYPRGSYPLTEACISEMIVNNTLVHYKLDVSSEKFSRFSLLQALLIIRSVQDKVKEIALNSHNANIDVQMTSPLSAIRSTKKMSFVVNYPAMKSFKNLPNIYFSQEFLSNFIDKKIVIVNVYPKIIVYNNEMKLFDPSNGWNQIYTGVDETAYKIYANMLPDDRISLRIAYRNYELILKPKLVSIGTIDSNEPVYATEIYYNQELFSDFDQRLHLFSTQDILFSLSKVDDYVVIRSSEMPVIIYYTINSITVFQKI